MPRLRNRGHRPRQAGLRERALNADASGDGAGMVLLPHHRLGASGAGVEREHRICRFSASDAGHRARRLHAAHLSDPRAAAALLVGNLRAGSADGAAAGRVWRRNGPADPAVRHRRVPGVYAVAGGDGDALEAHGRFADAHDGERRGRVGHGHHDGARR